MHGDIFDFEFNVGDLANFIYLSEDEDEKICVRIVNVQHDTDLDGNRYFVAAPKIDLDKAGCQFYKDVDTSFLKEKYNIGPKWDIGIACADELVPPEVGFIKLISDTDWDNKRKPSNE